jgi:transcriptional regulator with XRE-family HTH domain
MMVLYLYMEVNGMKLREIREDRTLSARELAEAAGVHYNTVLRLENNPGVGAHPKTIRKLAKALSVDPRELRSGQ